MKFDSKGFDSPELKTLYKALLLPRLIEEKMLILLRQGRISKWFSGMGQEAISVGATYAMGDDEFILPMHRNLGIFTTRDVELRQLFAQFQGKMEGFTKGRDRSFHFGSIEHKLVGMISHLGPQLGIADGIALGHKLKGEDKSVLVVTGDGGASEGDFHEAINTASVWDLPVIFMVENNQWGLSTPSEQQFKFDAFIDKAPGYGVRGVQCDGNNILDVVRCVREVAEYTRTEQRPCILEMITFRMRGHEEASGTKYYPEGLQDEWAVKDPVENYERFLLDEGVITQEEVVSIRKDIKQLIQNELDVADSFDRPVFEASALKADLFKPFHQELTRPGTNSSDMRLIDAIHDALNLAMDRHDNLVLMGQDIADYGGVFKATEGFLEKYGAGRVRNTPLCESAIVGSGLGLSINGHKAMVEMQFADFVSEAITQICNNLAKIHFRWGQNADVVIRMPTGAGVGAGPFHSQSNEAWFTHIAGLKVVYPAFASDAKGLLLSAFEDPNPVMFFEHKALYRSHQEQVPEGYYTTPIGKAAVVKEGDECTIVSYGMGVHWALEWQNQNPEVNAEIIDLRTLSPLDTETIYQSVKKTSRVLVLHEDNEFGGIGGEVVTLINEKCFEHLDAPVRRLGSLDLPIPFAHELEKGFLANDRLDTVMQELLKY